MTALIASHITTSPPAVVSVNVFPKSREKSFCATCFGNDPALSMISVSQESVYLSIHNPSQLGGQSFKRVPNCLAVKEGKCRAENLVANNLKPSLPFIPLLSLKLI